MIVLRVSSGLCLWCLVCSTVFCFAQESNETIFSGPQSGEVIPALTVELLSGENRGATLDLTSHIDDRPSVLIFIHQLTRPGFGLMRTVGDFASKRPITSGQSAQNDASSEPSDETDKNADSESTSRKEKTMPVGVVFLSEDKTETIQWASNVQRLFSDGVIYAVSPDGIAGPGAFGLNRNVTMTVLVCDKGKVVSNFALLQPQLQADGPAMIDAIVKVSGGGEVPSLESILQANRGMMRQRPQAQREGNPREGSSRDSGRRGAERDPKVGGRDNPEKMRGTTEEAGEGTPSRTRGNADPQLVRLVRGLISKSLTDEEVSSTATRIERYLEIHPEGKGELISMVNRIMDSGRLENYGTPAAQKVLRDWQQEYRAATTKANQKPKDRE